MTNDGGLARVLELPATGWLRRYRVRAHGRIDQAQLDTLSGGVTLDGVDYAGIEARLDREQGSNAWITMGLREGKNREIKKVLEHLGLAVNRLIRISFGPFELGDLAEGEVAEVRTRVLRDQLGAKLAQRSRRRFRRADRRARRGRSRNLVKSGKAGAKARLASGPALDAAATRSAGRRFEKDAAPRRKPPAPSTPERRRKHVSALRAEIAADAAGPRKRIARSATHDRKGRTIAVERISPAGEESRKRAAEVTRKPRGAGGPARGERRPRSFEPKRETAERPRRPDSFGVKRSRDGEGRERPPRAEREGRGAPRRNSSRAGRAGRRETVGRAKAVRPGLTARARSAIRDAPPREGRDDLGLRRPASPARRAG